MKCCAQRFSSSGAKEHPDSFQIVRDRQFTVSVRRAFCASSTLVAEQHGHLPNLNRTTAAHAWARAAAA